MAEKNVYEEAIRQFGGPSQLEILQEECAELIQAVSKVRRGHSIDLLVDEIADVEIMLAQARLIIGATNAEKIEGRKRLKLGRLAQRLGV